MNLINYYRYEGTMTEIDESFSKSYAQKYRNFYDNIFMKYSKFEHQFASFYFHFQNFFFTLSLKIFLNLVPEIIDVGDIPDPNEAFGLDIGSSKSKENIVDYNKRTKKAAANKPQKITQAVYDNIEKEL